MFLEIGPESAEMLIIVALNYRYPFLKIYLKLRHSFYSNFCHGSLGAICNSSGEVKKLLWLV